MKNTDKLKVLIADDSTLILERLLEILGMFDDVEVVGMAGNGMDALASLKKYKPDLAIVDFKMPGLNGLEVLSEIRKENKNMVFMLLTFYSSAQYRHQAFESGTDYFFTKSDDFDQVSDVVALCIRRKQLFDPEYLMKLAN